jgi:hypothetical protein
LVVGAVRVKTSTHPDKLEIAPGYTVECWKCLSLDPDAPNSVDWHKAIEIFDSRIRRRFLDPVDELIKIDGSRSRQAFGFAILAIDFLVIETLQGFREGKINHKGRDVSKNLIKGFLLQWDAFTSCLQRDDDSAKRAEQVYTGYRCALHHTGSTEGDLRIGITGKTFAFKNSHEVKINRT